MSKVLNTRPGWRKSSHSGGGNDCVEVNNTNSAICDTKDPAHDALQVGRAAVNGLFAVIRTSPEFRSAA